MAKDHIRDYDTTAGNNTDVDGVSIAEGTAPSNINDAIREVMAHQAELHGDTRGGLTSGGSGGAYTLSTNESLSAYAQSGGLFVWEANHAMPDTVTATLNIDSVGAKPLRKDVSLALSENDIKANQMVISAYEASNDVVHILSVLGNANVITTQGDLIRGADGGGPERVALGAQGGIVYSDGSDAAWLEPSSAGEIVRYDGTDATWGGAVVPGSAVDLSSGNPTEADFSSLPAWIKRVTVLWKNASTNGTDEFLVQLGTSGGLVTSNYECLLHNASAGSSKAATNGFSGNVINAAGGSWSGRMTLENIDGNVWVMSVLSMTDGINVHGAGEVDISGTLTQVRFTTDSGTDTFDAGTVNILYE